MSARHKSDNTGRATRWKGRSGLIGVVVMALLGALLVPQASAAPTLGLTISPIAATVQSGDTATFQIAWSCSSTSETCDLGTISVPVPTLAPDTSVRTTYVQGTASTGGLSGAPTVSGGVISWKMADSLAAGSSGQMTFTVRVPNISSPNGNTVNPVATFTASGVTQTATTSTTVVSDTDLVTDKRLVSSAVPGLDVPVVYQVATMHRSSINTSTGRWGGAPSNGTWGVVNVVTVDHLPVGAEFVSATGGGVYDAASHTVTWPAWSDNGATGAFTIAPDYQIAIRYPSSVFAVADIVTNTATASANPYLRPEVTVTSEDDASHSFRAASNQGAIGKGPTFTSPNSGLRDSQTGRWGISVSNTGTGPLALDIDDALPCLWSSPTDGSTDCETPAVTNVQVMLQGGQAGVVYTLAYATNLGTTGTVSLTSSTVYQTLPNQSATEWVTAFELTGTIPGGDRIALDVLGRIAADLPAESTGAVYRHPNVPVGTPVMLENCLTGSLSTLTGTPVTSVQDVCGYTRVDPDRPSYRAQKYMTNNIQGIGGEIDVAFGLQTAGGNANWNPILTDLLPADLAFVPGSVSTAGLNAVGKAALPDANLLIEVIDDFQGTGRQLVRLSWPGAPGLAPNLLPGQVAFKVSVQPGAVVGQRTNELIAFDQYYLALGTPAAPQACFVMPTAPDANNQSGRDNPALLGCVASATYTVVASPAIGGTKWVKGSADTEFLSAPSVGLVLAGQDAEYRLDVENTGNVPVDEVVAYEILPYVGDTGVGPAVGDDRGSQWQTVLSGAVTSDVPTEISYSTSANPCRGEVMAIGGSRADGPAGCVDDWTTTLPADPSEVRAIRVDFGTTEFAVDQIHSVTIAVTTPSDADGIAWNSFAVAAQEASTGEAVLPVEPNKVGLRAQSSLSVDKSVAQATVTPSGEVTWTIVVTNDGAGRTGSIVVVDRLHEDLEYLSSSSTNGSYHPDTQEWTLAEDLTAGASATLTITTRVNADAPLGELCNLAEAYLPAVQDEPIDDATACTVVEEPTVPNIAVVKSSDPASGKAVQPGQDISYTLTFSNTGNGPGEVDYTDDLTGVLDDADLTAAPSSSDGALVVTDGSDGQLHVTGTLEPGAEVTVVYTVTVKPDGERGDDVLTNVVFPTGTENPTCQDENVSCTEHPVPGFELTKTSDPASGTTVNGGDTITYTVTATNTGATVLDPVVINDDMAAVLNHAGYNGDAVAVVGDGESGDLVLDGTTLTWTGALAVGQTVTITYSVTVNAGAADVVLHNIALGSATPPGLPPITPPPVETEHPVPPTPTQPPSTTPPTQPPTTKPTPPSKPLPHTGAAVTSAGIAALVLLGVGGTLLVARRRRGEQPAQ